MIDDEFFFWLLLFGRWPNPFSSLPKTERRRRRIVASEYYFSKDCKGEEDISARWYYCSGWLGGTSTFTGTFTFLREAYIPLRIYHLYSTQDEFTVCIFFGCQFYDVGTQSGNHPGKSITPMWMFLLLWMNESTVIIIGACRWWFTKWQGSKAEYKKNQKKNQNQNAKKNHQKKTQKQKVKESEEESEADSKRIRRRI